MVIYITVAVVMLYLPNVEKASDVISDFYWETIKYLLYFMFPAIIIGSYLEEKFPNSRVLSFISKILMILLSIYGYFLFYWLISIALNTLFYLTIKPLINFLIGQ